MTTKEEMDKLFRKVVNKMVKRIFSGPKDIPFKVVESPTPGKATLIMDIPLSKEKK